MSARRRVSPRHLAVSLTAAAALVAAGCATAPGGAGDGGGPASDGSGSDRAALPAQTPAADAAAQAPRIAPFSGARPGGAWPKPWAAAIVAPTKKRTAYELVEIDGRTVLRARALASASALHRHVDLDPRERPWLQWSWRVSNLIPGADVADRYAEDSPVRLILAFDGDKAALPVKDRMLFERAKLLTGRELPYATLMYVWENRAPLETVIENPHTGRIRKIVVGSGERGVGRWQRLRRDIVADYRRAFGVEPGRLIGVGVMTDTDNTGESAEAFYGDIELTER